MSATIPDSHLDLLCQPVHGVLTTMMPDGQPQSSIVWVDFDSPYILINTTLERQKGRNMRANPRVTLLVIALVTSSLTHHHASRRRSARARGLRGR